jgi:hypothetical protein
VNGVVRNERKTMKKLGNAFMALLLSINVAACASKQYSPPFSQSSDGGAYIAKIPGDKIGFVPEALSGDGKAVIGLAFPDEGLWKWTRSGGLNKLIDAPQGEQTFAAATDYTGNVAVGSLLPGMGHLTGMFRWTKSAGLQLLAPPLAPAPPLLELSEDGKQIIFSCPGDSAFYPTCPGSNVSPKNWPSAERLWNTQHGFQILGEHVTRPFDYISSAGDFSSYLVGKTGTATTRPTLGRLDSKGLYTAFDQIPDTFNPTKGVIVTNSNMTLVAYQGFDGAHGIWDASGRPISLQIPNGCNSLSVEAIDNAGAIFALGECPGYNAPAGVSFRITTAGAETISDWLKNAGVQNNLAPNTGVSAVSDDGKTILGATNVQPPAIVRYDLGSMPKIFLTSETTDASQFAPSYFFVAHLP